MLKLKEGTFRKIGGTNFFEIEESFQWLIDYEKKDGYTIIVEKGFITDFGSIPRLFRVFFDHTKYNSYILHDKIYSTKMKYHIKNKEFEVITRKEADRILLEGLEYEGASTIEKFFIYYGVRLGGWYRWNFN